MLKTGLYTRHLPAGYSLTPVPPELPMLHGAMENSLHRAATPASSTRFLTEQEEQTCVLWLCLLCLVFSLVYATVNKYPLKDFCTQVKGSFQVLLNEPMLSPCYS